MVCVDNQQLEEAGEVHRLCIQAGLQPDAYAYNALINAYGCALQVPAPHPENISLLSTFNVLLKMQSSTVNIQIFIHKVLVASPVML